MSENIDSEHQVENGESNDGSESRAHQVPSPAPLYHADSREEMFEDASDELDARSTDGRDAAAAAATETGEVLEEKPDMLESGSFHETNNDGVGDSDLMGQLEQLRVELEKTVGEKEFIAKQYKEEREAIEGELGHLRRQLKAMSEQQPLPGESNGELVDSFHEAESGDGEEKTLASETPLHELIHECSQFLKRASEERLRTEGTIRELNAILFVKDQEIEDLNAKVTEMSVSQDVAASYMDSVQKAWSQSVDVSSELLRESDEVTNRVLASLAMVVNQEEVFDSSGSGKMVHVEKGTSLLIEKYNQILYEVDQLRQCLPDPNFDLRLQDEFGPVFAAVRNELQQLTRKEADLIEKLTHLEDENRKLMGQLDEHKAIVENMDAELKKTKMQVEQEKMRSANTKEKLSLAVTKGKALVQQRDSLKHSLADKTSELEKCLVEIREKSTALEAAELRIEELVKSEKLVVSLQETLSQRDAILKNFEELLSQISLPEELQSIDIVQKYRWIVDEVNGLKGELLDRESLISSLQEMIRQKDAVFEKFEEILSQTVSEELLERDIFERFRWIVEERNVIKGELVRSESSVVSLQVMLLQRNVVLENIEEILSQTSVSEEVKEKDIIERIRWLVDERNVLNSVSLEFHKLKDGLLLIDLPESFLPSDLESRVCWLRESFCKAKDEISMLQDEIARTQGAAQNEIDQLSASLSAELQEKDHLQTELDDLTCKYREIVEKEHQVSEEKDRIVKILLEISGVTIHDKEGDYQPSIDAVMLINRCIEKIKEQSSSSFDSSCLDSDLCERIQSFLYVRNHELMLYEEILEEDLLVRSEVNNLSNELRLASQELLTLKEEKALLRSEMNNLSSELSVASQEILTVKEEKRSEMNNLSNELNMASQELLALKEEKGSLQKDLERSEEKAALLREKLSMAVKKGKGLVQDRENLRHVIDEKTSEIEKLRLELQQQESAVADCRDEISRLSTDVDRIPKLEADLVALNDRKDQVEQFLLESNDMLRRVIESIDSIVLPVDSVFEEPVEKVKWLANYLNECQDSKSFAEQELEKMKEEADTLASKLVEAQTTLKSLEDALSVAENNISQISEEKREIEVAKTNLEEELKEARSQTSEFAEVYASRNSLEDALLEVKRNISVLTEEKEEAQASKAATEIELEKVKDEVSVQTSKLAEAYRAMKSLEDALSEAESNIALLAEQNNNAQVGRTSLENEIQKLHDEAESQAHKMEDAFATIKSLEDALLKAKSDISALEGEKKIAEQEISTLNSKLSACMDELAGTSGSLESRSVELIGHLSDLQVLMKDESLLSIMKQCFEKKFESLRDMDLILNNIRGQFVDMGSEVLQSHPVMEEDSWMGNLFSDGLDNILSVEMGNGEGIVANGEDISSYFKRTMTGFQLRNKIVANKFEDFSAIIDELVAALVKKLQASRDDFIVLFEHHKSLEKNLEKIEMYKQEQENTITSLENDVNVLLSACCEATRDLQLEVANNLLEISSVPELEKLKHSVSEKVREVNGEDRAEHQQTFQSSKYKGAAESLLLATRKFYSQTKQFESTCNVAAATIEELQNRLEEIGRNSEKAMEERDLNQNKVSKLESDVEALQSSCSELRLKLQEYQGTENKLKEREAELSSLYEASLTKDQGMEDSLLSASEVKTLLEKLSEIEIPFAESEIGDTEHQNSVHVKKLFYTIDSFTELQHQIKLLSHDKEELESALVRQSLEIEHLEEEVETNRQELSELTLGLEKIINMLGDEKDFTGDQKSASVKRSLPVIEKQLMTLLLESESSKAKSQELGTKLLESHKVVEELSNKVRLLEDSRQGRIAQPEIVQERRIFEAPSLPTGSEISEIEDAGSVGKNSVSPPGSTTAAHVRTMKKGSTDHLALNIDPESVHLINNEDEDKGHAFKSLNTSGLIPTQGKLIADRIDGIWVSGGRVLMSRPRARLGLVAYWLVLHLWLLGTIL